VNSLAKLREAALFASPRPIPTDELAGLDDGASKAAIAAALEARKEWANWPWEDRAAVMLRAAELLAGPWRATLNAATMLGQAKTAFQTEIDASCELIDFLRFNVAYAQEIYSEQPISGPGVWNSLEYRALEGFVYAVSPFNFTAIGGNLSSAPALMGNTVVWKPASSAITVACGSESLTRMIGQVPVEWRASARSAVSLRPVGACSVSTMT